MRVLVVNDTSDTKIIFRNLDWDSEYFGVKCGRIDLNDNIDDDEKSQVSKFAEQYDFVTITNQKNCNLNNVYIGKELKAFLADVNIQFEKYPISDQEIDSNIKIYNCYSKNESLVNMVEGAYKHSRFFNDSHISSQKASGIYQNWVRNSFNNKNKYFVNYEEAGLIKGFLICSVDNKRNLIIELICVSEEFKGNGIGKALIKASEKITLENQLIKIKVGTQIENISALNFYKSCGFILIDISYIYHLWN